MMMDLRQFDITLFFCGGPVWWVLTELFTPAKFLEMASFVELTDSLLQFVRILVRRRKLHEV